jgi:hypothetical protein
MLKVNLHQTKFQIMKKIINLVVIALVLIFNNNGFASGDNTPATANTKASISGKVVDIKTGEPLAGVNVSVEGTDFKAYSDLDGTFTINSIDAGNYNLILSLISYKNSLVENLKVNPSEKEFVDIKLDVIR